METRITNRLYVQQVTWRHVKRIGFMYNKYHGDTCNE